jgi:hypothetical protein
MNTAADKPLDGISADDLSGISRTNQDDAKEAQSGLEPWILAELPAAPSVKGFGWIGVVGPGVIVLGAALGSGEFLLGPAVFVRYGFSLLWVTTVAVLLQTVFNTEVMRYTLATGEPVLTGFMRTRPSSTLWALIYAGLALLQVGWPAWAGTAAAAVFFLFAQRLAGTTDSSTIYFIGVATFLACVVILSIGKRIARTLEILNWVMIATILGGFIVLAVILVPPETWFAAAAGMVGFDSVQGSFNFMPVGMDFFLLGALVAYSGCGGIGNLSLSNYARDKGYGMGERIGYISSIGSEKVPVSHSGFTFDESPEAAARWRGWWRIIRADQWGVFFTGAILGMVLPALLYVTLIPRGSDIQGLGIGAALAHGISDRSGVLLGGTVALLGAWLLFKSQLDILEGMVRTITDLLWTGNQRIRSWRGGDIRAIYYSVLAVVTFWGIVALGLAQPIFLLKLGANMAAVIMIIASLHLLYINTRLLPRHVRPPMWRRLVLIGMALFYSFFVILAVSSFTSSA